MGRLHRYCARPGCVKASRVAAQKKWLRHEKQGEPDKVSVIRTQQWRLEHPGYWRRKVRLGRYEIQGELASVVRDYALQDMMDTQFSLVIGLVSYLTQSALQDTIASEIQRLIVLGHGILTQSTKADSTPTTVGRD